RRAQTEVLPLHRGRIRIAVGNARDLAHRVERPGVVEALEALRDAGVLTADRRATVRTRVEEHVHLTVHVAHAEQRPSGHGAAAEGARLRDLALVRDVEPGAREQALLL